MRAEKDTGTRSTVETRPDGSQLVKSPPIPVLVLDRFVFSKGSDRARVA